MMGLLDPVLSVVGITAELCGCPSRVSSSVAHVGCTIVEYWCPEVANPRRRAQRYADRAPRNQVFPVWPPHGVSAWGLPAQRRGPRAADRATSRKEAAQRYYAENPHTGPGYLEGTATAPQEADYRERMPHALYCVKDQRLGFSNPVDVDKLYARYADELFAGGPDISRANKAVAAFCHFPS